MDINNSGGLMTPLMCCAFLASILHQVSAVSDEKRLIKHLLDRYDSSSRMSRPVRSAAEPLQVLFGLQLIQILDVDEKNQVITTNCWCKYGWDDWQLKWNKSDFGGIDKLRVPIDHIWSPDIVLFNYADDRLTEKKKANAVIESTGFVFWMPQAIFRSTCILRTSNFPFDMQVCKMLFGSWTYPLNQINVTFMANDLGVPVEEIDLAEYEPNNEWHEVYARKATRDERNDLLNGSVQYARLNFEIELHRNVIYYYYVIIIPCVLLSFLTLIVFWLPAEAPAKMLLGMNIFVAFFFLLLLLAESTPVSSTELPIIGIYFVLNMFLITLSQFLAVVVVYVTIRGDRKNQVPERIKRLFIDWLAKLFAMRSDFPLDMRGIPKSLHREPRSSSSRSTTPRRQRPHPHHHQHEQQQQQQYYQYEYQQQQQPVSNNHAYYQDSNYHNNYTQQQQQQQQQTLPMAPMRYNKFQLTDEKTAASSYYGTTTRSTASSSMRSRHSPAHRLMTSLGADNAWDDVELTQRIRAAQRHFSPAYVKLAVENDAREVRRAVRQLLNRVHEKEDRMRIAMEWRIVGRVMDRVFFFAYLTIIAVSLIVIFSKAGNRSGKLGV